MSQPFVEKYRPTSFEQVIGQTSIVNSLKEMVNQYLTEGKKPPNQLYLGTPGTGKTTLAHCLGNALFGENYKLYFHEFNASDTRKIDDIREKIKPLSRSIVNQIIFFDEADGLTNDSQQALRRIIEQSQNTIFILSANNEQKLSEAIRSRCAPFYFQPLTQQDIGTMLKRVIVGENIQLKGTIEEVSAIQQIIKDSRGDLRKALNILEKIITAKKELNVQSVLELKPVEIVSEAIQSALSGDFEKAKNTIEDVYLKSQNVDTIIDSIYYSLSNIQNTDVQRRLYFELGELEHRIQSSHRPLYQLVSFISFVWIAPHLRK